MRGIVARSTCHARCLVVALAVGTWAASAVAGEKEFASLGMYPAGGPASVHRWFAPLADVIGQAAGRPVRLSVSASYAEFSAAAIEERFTYLVSLPHMVTQLMEQRGYQAVAQTREKTRIVLFTVEGRGVEGVAQLAGRTIVTPSRHSLAAITARDMLRDAGISDEVTIHQVESHDHALLMVFDGSADAGAIVSTFYDNLSPTLASRARVLESREMFPLFTILAQRGVGPAEIRRVAESLERFTAPDSSPQSPPFAELLQLFRKISVVFEQVDRDKMLADHRGSTSGGAPPAHP